MTTKEFSKKEAIQFGWNTTKNNLRFFIPLSILVWAVSLMLSFSANSDSWAISIMNDTIVWIWSLIATLGIIKISLNFCDNKESKLIDLFSQYRLFFTYLFGYVLYLLIILGGMILLIIPGIIWAIKFQFFGYLIVDRGLGPIEALKKSAAITKGVKWNLFLFGLLLSIITWLGILAFFIGLIIAAPVTWLASTFVYRKLLLRAESDQKSEISQISQDGVERPPTNAAQEQSVAT